MTIIQNKAIGVFDSGVGGLTVLAELQLALPNEEFVYLGDTARVPYGSRSPETIIRYSKRVAGHLVKRDIKALVVACNTATTYALDALIEACRPLNIVVFGVIEPSALMALEKSKHKSIAVLGTEGTINGGKYYQILKKYEPNVHIKQQACPLFVPIIEEGWHNHPVAKMVAEEYLLTVQQLTVQKETVRQSQIYPIDTVILGCTHYPLLKPLLESLCPQMTFIDSAQSTAQMVRKTLNHLGLLRTESSNLSNKTLFLVTDNLQRFAKVGYYFLGVTPEPLQLIDIHDDDEL